MNDGVEFSIVCKFLDDSPEFTEAFECGLLWHKMETTGEDFEFTAHSVNIQQIELMAQSLNWDLEINPTEYDEWLEIKFSKKLPGSHLRVVKND